MDERRDPQPAPEGDGRIVSVAGRLSPMQQAWSDYVDHGLKCSQCRSLEAGRCGDAERLHRIYSETSNDAFDQLADEG